VGDPSDSVWILLQGRIHAVADDDKQVTHVFDKEVQLFEEVDFVTTSLTAAQRSQSYIVAEEAECMVIPGAVFGKICRIPLLRHQDSCDLLDKALDMEPFFQRLSPPARYTLRFDLKRLYSRKAKQGTRF
jgi:hypothetical protein